MKSLFVFRAARRFWTLILLLALLVATPVSAIEWYEVGTCKGWNTLQEHQKYTMVYGIGLGLFAMDDVYRLRGREEKESLTFWSDDHKVADVVNGLDGLCKMPSNLNKLLTTVMAILAQSRGV